ncbi:MAG: hypothetical protein SVV03_02475 [Candidatus Nanohaloarchaea archaeon]|nr:hypothetical protein [Candidatus Nanohaloarchaea archaeon]
MSDQLFQVDREKSDKLRDDLYYSELDSLIKEHGELRQPFDENMEKEFPLHPYKIYRRLETKEDREPEEMVVLDVLLEEYRERWQRYRTQYQEAER